jgi:hypothetical protein
LPSSKKLPAPWSGSFCSKRGSRAKAGFQLSLE